MKTLTNHQGKLFEIALRFTFFCSLLAILCSCGKDPFSFQDQNRQVLMLDQIRQDTSLSIAVTALDLAKMSGALNTYGPFTFFAPNNAAFKKYIRNQGKQSIKDFSEEELKTLMTYHILPTRLVAAQFVQGPQSTPTGRADYITLDISKGYKTTAVANGKATLYETDIEYSNGFVHKMDGVLDPPTLTIGAFMKQNPDKYSVFVAGLERGGMMDTVTNLTDASGARIRLTLFAETNEVLLKAGITNFNSMPLADLKAYMRYHILRGSNFSSSYTFFTPGIPAINVVERWDNTLLTLDGQQWIYFDLAAPKLINNASIGFDASDIIMRNGVLHNVDKQLSFFPGIKRTQIYHVFAANPAYPYGISGITNGSSPVIGASSGNWRTYSESTTPPLSRGTIQMLFGATGKIGDSVVTVVKNVRAGKYRFEVNYKSGTRGDFQMKYQEDNIGTPVNYGTKPANWPTDFEQKIVVGIYEFKSSVEKRIIFVCTRAGSINLDCMVMTPQY